MNLLLRLNAHPEILLPLWGMAGHDRSRDRSAVQKARFWDSLRVKLGLSFAVHRRLSEPENTRRASMLANRLASVRAAIEREPCAGLLARIEGHAAALGGRRGDTPRLSVPADIEARLEEQSPQMILRPIPRIEREVDDSLPLERTQRRTTVGHPEIDGLRALVRQQRPPRWIDVTNMDIIRAHRRFHQRLFHRTDWSFYLSADLVPDDIPGPAWMRRPFDGWEPLLDPIPLGERPARSGYLFDRDTPVPLE